MKAKVPRKFPCRLRRIVRENDFRIRSERSAYDLNGIEDLRKTAIHFCLPFAETEDHSGAEPEITLAIVIGIQKLRVQIFRLRQPHTEAVIYFPVHAATCREIKIIVRAERRKSRAKRVRVKRAARTATAK
jgi:hypothetical protein